LTAQVSTAAQLNKMPDRGYDSKRKSKNDKRAKARYNKYKKGGSQRSTKIKLQNEQN
jgi:hypothetical protein